MNFSSVLTTLYSKKLMIPMAISFVSAPLMATLLDALNMGMQNYWKLPASLIVLVILDTAIGAYLARKDNKFSSKGFGQFVDKAVAYGFLVALMHTIYFITTIDSSLQFDNAHYIVYAVYSGLWLREIISVLEFISILQPGAVPDFLKTAIEKLLGKTPDSNHSNENIKP